MTIQDKVYGEIEITEPILQDIIASKPFQRLKNVNHYGGVNLVYPGEYTTTRYEHCIGVWFVAKTAGADIDTQIAALMHDIGHTAFSHMVDHALGSKSEDFHEKYLHLNPGYEDLMKMINNKGFFPNDPDSYPIIKPSSPSIGADRFDYAMRDYKTWDPSRNTTKLVQQALSEISASSDGLVFETMEVAREFCLAGLQALWEMIYEPKLAVVYMTISELIKLALDNKWIKLEDLYLTDQELLDIIWQHSSEVPDKYQRIFKDKFRVEYADQDYDFKHTKSKIRYYDPFVKTSKGKQRLSEMDEVYRVKLKESLTTFEKRQEGVGYKVIYQ